MNKQASYFCMDVHYLDSYAVSAGILFNDIESDEVELEKTVEVNDIQPYESGLFYKRELPCLTALIDSLDQLPKVFIVDSFVQLDISGKPGMGAYLYDYYKGEVPVIGVAKNGFKENSVSKEVFRGESTKPLYVTSVGMALEESAEIVQKMHGDFRFPTLLKKVDALCRGIL